MARTSKEELQAMYRSKQVIKHDRLLTMLGHFGFENRRSGGGTSHINVWCPQYPELNIFRIIAGTNKVDSQRIAINQCLKIIEWEEALRKNTVGTTPSPIEEFEAVANIKIIIPDDFELVQGRKNPGQFLRYRKFPQIATQIDNGKDQNAINENITYLRDRVAKLDEALNSAIHDHDFEIERHPNGAILLSHSCHDVNVVLYPFTPRLENFTSISIVEEAIEDVQIAQIGAREALDVFIEYYCLQKQGSSNKNIETYDLPNPFYDGTRASISLSRTPNGYISSLNILQFIQAVEKSLINGLNKDLKTRFGFILQKIDSDKIAGKHLLFDIEFQIDASDLNDKNRYENQIEEYSSLSIDEKDKMMQQFLKLVENYRNRKEIIVDALQDYTVKMQEAMTRLNKVIPCTKKMRPAVKPVAGTIGKFSFSLNGRIHPLEVLFLRSKSNSRVLIPTLETIERLEQLTKETQFNGAGFGLAKIPDATSTLNSPKDSILPLPPSILFGPKQL